VTYPLSLKIALETKETELETLQTEVETPEGQKLDIAMETDIVLGMDDALKTTMHERLTARNCKLTGLKLHEAG
jgi:hypothetical protein